MLWINLITKDTEPQSSMGKIQKVKNRSKFSERGRHVNWSGNYCRWDISWFRYELGGSRSFTFENMILSHGLGWWPRHLLTTWGWFWVHARNAAHVRPQIRKWAKNQQPPKRCWFWTGNLVGGLNQNSAFWVFELFSKLYLIPFSFWSLAHFLVRGLTWAALRAWIQSQPQVLGTCPGHHPKPISQNHIFKIETPGPLPLNCIFQYFCMEFKD